MKSLLPEDSMREIDVHPVPTNPQSFVLDFAKKHALAIKSEGTLKAYPGCIHWHLERQGESGTLEATWWPSKKDRFWFKIAANRGAAWIDAVLNSM